jgi:monoamine oxidase
MKKLGLNRRTLLQMLLASSGALAATPIGRARAAALDGVRVVVVGAGCAGLGAARSLHNQGAEVIVVEGKPHIGGRLLTDWSMGPPFEVGAGWIHGPEAANPTRGLCDAVGAKYVVTDDDNVVAFTAEGDEFSDELYEHVWESWDDVTDHINNTYDWNDPRSLEEAIRNYDSDLLEDPAVMWAFSAWTEFSKGGPVEDLSAPLFNWDKKFDSPDVVVTTGYDEMLKPLAEGLDIRLSHTVSSIAYSEDTGVRVETDKGVIEADYCICTAPLGVLKAGTIRFDPPLPDSYQESIEAVGFGTVTKLALKFDEPFWDIETQYFGIMTEPKGRWNYWLNYRTFSDENILLGLSVGAYAPIADRMSQDDMIADALPVLRMVWGDDVGTPVQALSTHWLTDPYALGAYAYPRPGNSRDDYDGLADGIDERLFLAGEHTIFDYAGTTHGAYMTGLRAAEKIIDLAT